MILFIDWNIKTKSLNFPGASCTWVIKSNWLHCHTIHDFQKQDKRMVNMFTT